MADLKKEILAISRRPENALCVDCRMPQPTWASFNLGVFMCMTCAGHHRSLGTHITRVRSVTMDNWDAPSVALMGSVGNVRANTFFEAKLQPHNKIHPGVDDNARREFITAKYVNRAFYAAPAGGAASATAASAPVAEVKPLSKMEQRQLRLQAKQASASSTPQPTTSASPAPIPQPSAPIRQSSTPVPTHTATNPDANLFAGMNVAKPAAAAVAAPVPVPAAAPKVHSSSPWVTREQHQQIQQQQQHHLQQPHHHMSHSSSFPNQGSSNILDFNAPAPATAVAASNGVDDMFAGLSVANVSASASPSIAAPAAATNGAAAAGAKLNSSELLSFYAYEPASAPARSQHPPTGSVSVGASPALDMFGSLNTNQQAVTSAQPIIADPSASTSSFSFLSEPAAPEPAAAASASAFSFLGGDDHHVPASTTTSASPLDNFSDLLPPADSASAPPLLPAPDLSAFGTQPAAALQPLPFLNNVTMPPMVGVGGQPAAGFMPMGNAMDPNMNPMGMQGMQGMQGMGAPYGMPNAGVGAGAPMMNPTMGLLFPTNMPLIPALAQQPMHGHSLLPSSSPMFMVQSVQASQAAAQQQATALANDPFAHIHVTAASPAPVPTVSPTQQNLAPKQPHQCDVDGCDGKKVSRGLCAKHIRGVDGSAATATSAPTAAAADSTFGFLTATNSATLQQQAPVEASGFGFI